MLIDVDRPNEGFNIMTMKTVIAKQARGVALAGFLLCLTGGWAVVSGGEPSGWKDTVLRGLDNDRIKLATARRRRDRPDLLLDGVPDLQLVQPDTRRAGRQVPAEAGELGRASAWIPI